jgi:hypothetical protein
MVDEKTTKKKRGPQKGTTKGKTTNSVIKFFQKEYNKLIEEKKKIEKKMKVYEKSTKDLGFNLSKRVIKIKEEIEGKPKGRPGRKKKEVMTEGKSE